MPHYKKIIIPVAIGLLVIIILMILILSQLIGRRSSKNDRTSTDLVPSITPVDAFTGDNNQPELRVVSTKPDDGAMNVSLTTPVEITFDKDLDLHELEIEVFPEVPFVASPEGKMLTVTFQEPLQESTIYTYTIYREAEVQLEYIYAGSFTALGPTPTPIEYRSAQVFEEEMQRERLTNPDIYLANFIPYEAETFTFDGELYDLTEETTFKYTVTIKQGSEEEAREAVTEWLSSLELTPEQINSLEITYK
ncbi:MAG: Ig-like domain-containing protein [Patescibacteria group bacterium]